MVHTFVISHPTHFAAEGSWNAVLTIFFINFTSFISLQIFGYEFCWVVPKTKVRTVNK